MVFGEITMVNVFKSCFQSNMETALCYLSENFF